MKVKMLMTHAIVSLKSSDTIFYASQLMRKHQVGCLPITNDQLHVTGIVTDRDIVIRGIAKQQSLHATVETIMTKTIRYVFDEDDVGTVVSMMSDYQVKRIIVLNSSRELVGIVTLKDLALHEMTDASVQVALKNITKPSKDSNMSVDVDDFPL